MKYTQREWDRVVGWGTVPPEYAQDTPSGLQVIVRDGEDYDLVFFSAVSYTHLTLPTKRIV